MTLSRRNACRARLVGFAVAGAAITLLAPAASAGAAKHKAAKLKTASASAVAVGALDPVTATATCPKGTRVVAGGYETTAPAPPGHWLNVHESQRASSRAWRVSAVEALGGTDTLTAYAYCQPFSGKIKARSAQVALPATASAGAVVQATCPNGSKTISGGFAVPAATATDSSLVSRSIRAGGDRWVVDATNLLGSSPRTLTALVYCAAVGKVAKRFEDAAVVGPTGSLYTATTPGCPKQTTARAGGFATSTPVGGLLNAALVYENRRAGATWSASAAASSPTTSITLITDAYCR